MVHKEVVLPLLRPSLYRFYDIFHSVLFPGCSPPRVLEFVPRKSPIAQKNKTVGISWRTGAVLSVGGY
jgi:hypothetical protein